MSNAKREPEPDTEDEMASNQTLTADDQLVVYFGTGEVARLLDVDPDLIRSAVKQGIVTPVIRGRPGHGNKHHFSGGQVIALGYINVLRQQDGMVPKRTSARLVALYGSMSPEVFYHWVAAGEGLSTARGREAVRRWHDSDQWQSVRACPPIPSFGQSNDAKTRAAFDQVSERIRQAAVRKFKDGAERTAEFDRLGTTDEVE
jgi:hypothetical protein